MSGAFPKTGHTAHVSLLVVALVLSVLNMAIVASAANVPGALGWCSASLWACDAMFRLIREPERHRERCMALGCAWFDGFLACRKMEDAPHD